MRVPPPGALADPTPRRTARSRDGDRFFILVTPAGDIRASAGFFEQMAQLAAETYFNSGGGVTGGLREALIAVHQAVGAAADGQPVSALALVQREAELYVARSGPIFAALRGGAGLVTLPDDRTDPLAMNLLPLGSDGDPDIQLKLYDVVPGLTLLIANLGLADAEDAALRAALAQASLPAVMEQIKRLAGPETSASVIRFGGEQAAGAVSAQPLSHPASEPAAPVYDPDEFERADVDEADELEALVEDWSRPAADAAPVTDADADLPPVSAADLPPASDESVIASTPLVEDRPTSPADDAAPADGLSDAARAFLSDMTDRVRTATQTSRAQAPGTLDGARLSAKRVLRDVLKALLGAVLVAINGLQAAFNRLIPEPEEGKPGIPTNVAVGTAILVPIVITVAVVGLVLSRQGKTEFENYLEQARTAHSQALRLSGENCDNLTLRPLWEDVLNLSQEALQLREDDLEVQQIRADAQNYLDCYDGVQRRSLKVLHEFDQGAQLVGPIVQNGIELYTLDRASGAIYRDTLNEKGDGLTARGDVPIYRGQAVSGFVVGDLFDIEYLSSGATVHDNVLIALDTNGLLVSYSPTFFASAQQLIVEGRWVRPQALAVFRGNLYVLDTGASQVWRYVAPAGERRYSYAPEEYFIGENRPNLSNAVDLGISDTGDVYILYADGSITKYRGGEPQPFAYADRPDRALLGGTALFVDSDPLASSLLIVDPTTESIYETLWGGKFQRAFRPLNDQDAFENISGVFADSVVRNNMYVVAGNTLYHFEREPR